MHRRLLYSAVLLPVLLAAAGFLPGLPCRAQPAGQTAAREALRDVRRIVVLGDSITEMGGQPGGYVARLQEALRPRGIEVVNAGISGHRSTDMAARFRRDVLDRQPDLVLINVGVNDVWHAFRDFAKGEDHPRGDLPAGVPLPIYRGKLAEMAQAAKAAGARVVFLSPTVIYEWPDGPENRRLAVYREAMREVAGSNGSRYVDLYTPFRQILRNYQTYAGPDTNLLTTDGVHLNAAGNALMAAVILRALGVNTP